MPVEIEIDSTSPEQVRKCLADLEKAVKVDRTWGQLAIHTQIGTSEMAGGTEREVFCCLEDPRDRGVSDDHGRSITGA